MLNLPEQLLLLSYHAETRHPFHSRLSFGLVGAILAELLILKKIKRSGSILWCEDVSLTGDAILDEALTVMNFSAERHNATYWVERLHLLLRRVHARLAERLAAKGLLTATEHSSLGLFSFRRYRLSDPRTAMALVDQLRGVLFQRYIATPRQMALIGLVEGRAFGLFNREERKAVRARVGEILKRDEISKAVTTAMADVKGLAAAIVAASVSAER